MILFSLLLGGWAGYLASNQGKNISSQAHSIYSYYQIRYFIFTGSMTAVALIGLILAFVIPVGQNLKSKRASILLWSQPILSCALSFFAMTVGVNKTEAWPPWQRPAYPALWTSAPMSLSLGFLLTFFLASIRLAFSRDKIMKIHGYGGILFIFIFLYALIHIVWRTG